MNSSQYIYIYILYLYIYIYLLVFPIGILNWYRPLLVAQVADTNYFAEEPILVCLPMFSRCGTLGWIRSGDEIKNASMAL